MTILTVIFGGFKSSAFSNGNNRMALAAVALFAMWIQSADAAVQSPKGSEVFGTQEVISAPPSKTVTIGWTYPVQLETPDLVFKVYQSTNLGLPIREWALLTNIPGSSRTAILGADHPQQFFLMTASNSLGESDFATRD